MATRPTTDWTRCDSRPELPDVEAREYQADFETDTHSVEGASTSLRPDAIALDYWTAHTLGPVREGDVSEGLVSWVWRARTLDGYAVTLTRETDAHDGWEPNGAVFEITDGGPPIVELDVAFEQNGQAVVCVSRATGEGGAHEVWIYFYDPTIPGYTFANFGPGRTPRALLDRPLEVADSDVCVFYVADHLGRVAYRQQRDRYGVEIETPIEADENTFVEDIAKSPDRRVHVIYSVRDPESGTYEMRRLVSTLVPYVAEVEGFVPAYSLSEVGIAQVLRDAPAAAEGFGPAYSLREIVLREPVIVFEPPAEGFGPAYSLSDLALHEVVHTVEVDAEAFGVAYSLFSVATILTITIDRTADTEGFTPAYSLQTILLEAA